jgi:hypothetical protein
MSMMLTFRAGKLAALRVFCACLSVGACLSLGACSREQQDWRSAEAADTVDGYGQFLERHPDSELVTAARTRVAQLTEDREWSQAGSADTAEAYRKFLAQHPNGKWAQEARIRLQNFSLNGLSAQGAPEVGAGAAVGESSDSRPARAAQASPGELAQPASAYGVQLGAFASETAANAAWQQLATHFGAQLGSLVPRVIAANTTSGTLYRLQAQVPDEARARALCAVLRKESQACVPVLPH